MMSLHSRMACGIWLSLRENKVGQRWEQLAGYDVWTLKAHLESTMPAGHSWETFKAGALHIDHKKPRALFKFTSAEDPEFKACWALDNLQLLTAHDNQVKGAKYNA